MWGLRPWSGLWPNRWGIARTRGKAHRFIEGDGGAEPRLTPGGGAAALGLTKSSWTWGKAAALRVNELQLDFGERPQRCVLTNSSYTE